MALGSLNAPMSEYTANERRRVTVWPSRFEDPATRRERLSRTGQADVWAQPATSQSFPPTTMSHPGPSSTPTAYDYTSFVGRQRQKSGDWSDSGFQDLNQLSPWPSSPSLSQYSGPNQVSSPGGSNPRPTYTNWTGSGPWPLLRRTSSEDARLRRSALAYNNVGDLSASVPNLSMKQYPQRRPSNRDEFDGVCQMLPKPDDGGYEPKEEDMPQLPVNLYAQEQDDILSKVNDRLSQCAFDFVARYQFPIPLEPDKREVHVPSDREWSEWVYLLKRLATKRRIPARVLYNGQIKQLITILENSLEMRHAAKHQSRPLKDDRNVLQLISSGLQVAKILKDAVAMRYLDNLYGQTERVIQNRRAIASSTFENLSIM